VKKKNLLHLYVINLDMSLEYASQSMFKLRVFGRIFEVIIVSAVQFPIDLSLILCQFIRESWYLLTSK